MTVSMAKSLQRGTAKTSARPPSFKGDLIQMLRIEDLRLHFPFCRIFDPAPLADRVVEKAQGGGGGRLVVGNEPRQCLRCFLCSSTMLRALRSGITVLHDSLEKVTMSKRERQRRELLLRKRSLQQRRASFRLNDTATGGAGAGGFRRLVGDSSMLQLVPFCPALS